MLATRPRLSHQSLQTLPSPKRKHFISGNLIAFDTETTGVDLWNGCAPFAFSFCNELGETAYFEFEVDPFTRQVYYEPAVLQKIKALLEDEEVVKIGHNMKFDARAMELAFDIKLRGPGGAISDKGMVLDSYFMAHICNSLEKSFGLKQLGDKYGIMDTDDQKYLKKVVQRLRRKAKAFGWMIGEEVKERPFKPPQRKGVTEMDYWIIKAMAKHHPELVQPDEVDLCETYAVKDAIRTMLLGMMYMGLVDENGLHDIHNFEMQLWPLVYRMETRGLCVNVETLRASKQRALDRIKQFKEEIDAVAWPGFNPDSPHDVRKLVKKLGIEFSPEMLTPTGLPAVGREFLQANLDNPVVYTIAKYRTAVKTFSSFFCRYERLMAPDKLAPGFTSIHANFMQVGPATGRLSCREPNLQNVMDPTVSFAIDPQHVRHIFVPRPGYRWLCVDYSNMEVRVFADIAQEPVMLAAIREGRDIHSSVANQIWGGPNNPVGIRQAIRALSLDGTGVGNNDKVLALWKQWDITDPLKLSEKNRYEIADKWLSLFDYDIVKAQDSVGRRYARNIAKMVTFLKVYGGGLKGARKLLKDDHGNTQSDELLLDILHQYDESMPRIAEYSRELISQAKLDGFITTRWGRRLTIEDDFAYRAVNYMIQGSSADLMKFSMIRCDKFFREEDYDAHIILTVHDELISEVHESCMTHRLIKSVCDIMSDAEGRLSIDMPVEPKIVIEDWSKKKKIRM